MYKRQVQKREDGYPLLVCNTLPYTRTQTLHTTVQTGKPDFRILLDGKELPYTRAGTVKKNCGVLRKDIRDMDPKGYFYETEIILQIDHMKGFSYRTLYICLLYTSFLLLFVGFFIGFSRHGDTSLSGFIKTLPILLICIGAATLLNVLFHSYGDINMFYISPYKITTQPVFSQIMKRTGIWVSNLIYITAMCIAAFLIHRMFATIRQSCEK